MLPEVVSSSIETSHIVSPIRAFFRRVKFHNAEAKHIDLERRVVVASHCPMCDAREIAFDHLVLAQGSATDFHGIPGVAETALPMKTLGDAMALRNHILDVFEHADMESEPAVRRSMLTFVVAGGGFAGTETVAELHDFAHTAARFYSTIRKSDIRVVLVHSGPRIMPKIASQLAEYAMKKLKASGIEIVLNARVSAASGTGVELTGQQRIATKTLVWTAGVAPGPLISTLPCERNRRGQVIATNIWKSPVTRVFRPWVIVPRFPTALSAMHARRQPSTRCGKGNPLPRISQLRLESGSPCPLLTGPSVCSHRSDVSAP
jgi:NADH:ubiquinone reductase (H+-translocating)